MATQYTVKQGDTLNSIAQGAGYKDYAAAGITGFDNPDMIKPGQILTIGGGSTSQEVPGIGTLKITPKTIPTTSGVGATEDLTGAYARAGLPAPATPPPPGTANGYIAPTVAGLPNYPSSYNAKTSVDSILGSYNKTLDEITKLEGAISGAVVASPEEQQLQKDLAAKKAELGTFDLTSLQASEGLRGQGRGTTIGTINNQDTVLQRTRALERLGLAQEADTLTTQLGLAQDERKQQGDLAQTQYSLATKKLDIALGIQDKIASISKDEQDNARQFLLDAVNFSDGKTYDELDKDTQAAIVHSVANSPITLDMVKTALQSGSEKAAASAAGNLRSVAGVGVVQITTDAHGNATGYKVVVPENPADNVAPTSNAPSFTQYLEAQKIPFPQLTQQVRDQVKAEYDAKYGNTTVSLGKLTATDRQEITQAGLAGTQPAVQSYFLNAPAEFRNVFKMDVASGKIKGAPTLDVVSKAYTDWYNANQSGTNDWASILNNVH